MRDGELRESHAPSRLALALECADVGIYDWNLATDEVHLSREYFTILGYEPFEFGPAPDGWRRRIHPDDLALVEETMTGYHAGTRSSHCLRYRMRARDDRWVWVLSRGRLIEGPPRRLVGTHVDVSDQCQLEIELREARARLEQRVREADAELVRRERLAAVGHAVAGAAHSVRNVLTALRGGVALLQSAVRDASWSEVTGASELLGRSTRRLNLLVLEMLEHSKQRQARPERICMRAFAAELAEELVGGLRHEGIAVQIAPVDGELSWPIDGEMVQRSLMNLAMNAIDAMPGGGELRIAIRAATCADMPNGFRVGSCPTLETPILLIEVRDTGEGIRYEDLPRIFDPYFSTKGGRGTGLGLANVIGTVLAHEGSVVVDSAVGRGTSFWLAFPNGGGQ